MELILSRHEEHFVVDVHAVLFLLLAVSIAFTHTRGDVGEPEITSSHGYMYMPFMYPWKSRPFSLWAGTLGESAWAYLRAM